MKNLLYSHGAGMDDQPCVLSFSSFSEKPIPFVDSYFSSHFSCVACLCEFCFSNLAEGFLYTFPCSFDNQSSTYNKECHLNHWILLM